MFKFKPSQEWFKNVDKAESSTEIAAGIFSDAGLTDSSYKIFADKLQQNPDKYLKQLLTQVKAIGVPKEFFLKKIDIDNIVEDYRSLSKDLMTIKLLNLAVRTARAFRLNIGALLSAEPVVLQPLSGVSFKKRVNAKVDFLSCYTSYAYNLSQLVIKAVPDNEVGNIPSDFKLFREIFFKKYKEMSLENLIKFSWSVGIPVLPLRDSGAFSAACWRINGRSIIIVKESTDYESLWMNAVLHELYHISKNQNKNDFFVLDNREEIDDEEFDEEQEASDFPAEVILNGRAERLAEECVEAASGVMERLKSAVPKIANRHAVDMPTLANYVAFRLSQDNKNWWGAAFNLQVKSSPFDLAKRIFFENILMDRLSEDEQGLVRKALS